MDNIFAHTAAGPDMPEFISINATSDGGVSINVRSSKELGGGQGQITLTRDQVKAMHRALLGHLVPTTAA